MTNPSSPLSSTSSLTAESVGAQSHSHHHLDNDKSDSTVGNHRPPSINSRRSSSSSSTLTTTTVMLPSDDDRDESDLTEAEDDDELPRTSRGGEENGVESKQRVDSPALSEAEESDSDRSPSLSPPPTSALPDVANFTLNRSIRDSARLSPTPISASPAVNGNRDASPISDASEGYDDPASDKGDVESDQGSEAGGYENLRDIPTNLQGSVPNDLSAPASPVSDRSQSEQPEDPQDGATEVERSIHEGSVIDDDDASVTSPMFPSSSRSGHGSHAPPPTIDAMRAMFLLELKFAALRDQLYIDRMEEAAREEDLILTGLHPAVIYLHTTLVRRRERLHADARRRHKMAVTELQRAKEAEKSAVANWWLETREANQWNQYEGNWRKRRRLNREKSELEILRPIKSLPPKFPSEKDMDDRSFCWSGGPRASTLSAADIGQDLTNMGLRSRPAPYSRHASPAYYPPGLAGHPQSMMGHYAGTSSKSSNIFSNMYRPASSQAYYHEEIIDYGSHSLQADNLHRQQNGKQVQPARLYPHATFQNDSHDTMFGHAHSSLMPGIVSNSNTAQHAAQRREGRMVPTTESSTIFDARRREKDRVREKAFKSREGVPDTAPPTDGNDSRLGTLELDRIQSLESGRTPAVAQVPESTPSEVERSDASHPQLAKALHSRSMAWPYGGERSFVHSRSKSPSSRPVVSVDAE